MSPIGTALSRRRPDPPARPTPRPKLRRTQRAVEALIWSAVLIGVSAGFALHTHAAAFESFIYVMLPCFFPLIVARLVLAAISQPKRRTPLLTLAGAVFIWAVGSATLQTRGADTMSSFLSPATLLFLVAYTGFAAFLLLDTQRRKARAMSVWLDTTVLCAGTASLAGLVLLTPIALSFGAHGIRLLTVLLFPIFDVVLAIIVVGQVAAHQRRRDRRTVALVVGLLLLALADMSYVLRLPSDTYVGSAVVDVMYGVALALLVQAACLPNVTADVATVPRQRARTLVVAAAIATCVLVLHPVGSIAVYLVPPAVLTLAAAAGRLALALRESQGAAEALRLSRTDELTGLGNRRAVLAAVDAGLAQGTPLALMLLDLDGFKEINDSLGHAAGDGVLEAVATRLFDSIGDRASVGRLGGDEFALVLPDDDPERLVALAQRVRETLVQPLHIDSLQLAIRASIGITVRQRSDSAATDLLRRADVAMYEAKSTRSGALLYDPTRDGFSRKRLRKAEDLRRGIDEGQLVVWYQPQVEASSRRVVAAEALVRWQHPTEGLLPPIAFLPDARRAGLMLALTDAVMRQVVEDARRWAEQGMTFRVSLNCAPPELLGGALLPRLFEAIDLAGLPPERLMIEVTEDSFVADPEHARVTLQELRAHHVQTAIDDYGTGFSSLAYLRELPVDELKVDRSFVSTVRSDPRSRVIVDSTNQMAHAMGLRLVAEGVEDEEIAAELADMGVDVLQGYHIARPMPAEQVVSWVRTWTQARELGLQELAVS